MTHKVLLSFVFAVSLLVGATVRAEYVSGDLFFTTEKSNYLEGVHGSDWAFAAIGEHSGGQGKNPWTQWTYDFSHAIEGTATGAIYSERFNGNGANGEGRGIAQVSDIGTGTMAHNSANNFTMSFNESFVDTFYISLTPWSSYSAADAFDLTVKYWDKDGTLQTVTTQQTFKDDSPFLGFKLDEGAFLASVYFSSDGTNNNGYLIGGMGFGDTGLYRPPVPTDNDGGDTATTPEPATMLIVGLGLAGLGGLATRRRRK